MTLLSTQSIASYHAHVYFRDMTERARAAMLRDQVAALFFCRIGSWHDRPVGPHALPMYQIAFGVAQFSGLIPWLMLNRQDLPILVHPNTISPRRDHLTHAIWMGEILPIIRPEQLELTIPEEELERITANTEPKHGT